MFGAAGADARDRHHRTRRNGRAPRVNGRAH
jgi:hypothetical protein